MQTISLHLRCKGERISMLNMNLKKVQTLAFLLIATLLMSSFVLIPRLSADSPNSGGALSRNPKSKIYGVPPAALISELGEDAQILVSIYGSNAGIEAARTYIEFGNVWQVSSSEYFAKGVTAVGNLETIEGISEVSAIWTKMKPVVPDPTLQAPDPDNIVPETDMYQMRELLGVNKLYTELGLTGDGVTVAVVDTGTDYAHPDLTDALSYVTLGGGGGGREPLVLDADESQVLLFKTYTAVGGFILTAGKYVTVLDPTNRTELVTVNYNVGLIPPGLSGYKFGRTRETLPTGSIFRAGVLLTDPNTAGVYDTAYVDLNLNNNFNDDPAITYGTNRVTSRDMNNDGFPDRTAGVLGGFFYDTLGWFKPYASFMPGWDTAGKYMSIFYDYGGHGTNTAGCVASRGVTTFNIPTVGSVKLPGIAPKAKILAAKALWFGNTEPAMLWASGFDVDSTGKFYYTGAKRADIISNSWGVSSQVYDVFGFGYDFGSMLENGLATPGFLDPNFPGAIIVHAAGNGGFGYGTITSPGSASMVITIGASTDFHTVGYQFGNSPQSKSDDIISWSARAPTPVGEIKPDVMNVGAFAFDIANIWLTGAYTVFSGTSQATPLTAGVVALMLESTGKTLANPQTIRTILQTTAKDLGYNGLVQGSGRVDAYSAVKLAKGTSDPGFKISSTESMSNLQGILGPAWYLQWAAGIPDYFAANLANTIKPPNPVIPDLSNVPSGSLFFGTMKPGTANEFKLLVENPGTEDLEILSSRGLKYTKIGEDTITGTLNIPTVGDGRVDYLYNPSDFAGSTLTRFNLAVPFNKFDTNKDYTWDYRYRLWIFEWKDENNDGIMQESELRLYNYSYDTGTTEEATVANLVPRLNSTSSKIVVRVEGTKNTGRPALPNIPFTVKITKYARTDDTLVNLSPMSKFVPAGGAVEINGILHTPETATSGVHEGLIEIQLQSSTGSTTRVIPYTYVAVVNVGTGLSTITPAPSDEEVIYDLGVVRGSFDWRWRYEAGEWRVYAVEVRSDPVTGIKPFALEVNFQWTDPDTTVDVFILGPDGQFAGLYSGTGLGFSYIVPGSASGNYRFRWHSVYNRGRLATLQNIAFPQTSYIVGQYGYSLQIPAVFTIYVHEVLHDGRDGTRISEPITGTVRSLITSERLQPVVPITPGMSKALVTSVTLPYEVATSPTSPTPSNTASVIFDGAKSGPVTFSPTLPVSLSTTYPPNTAISTSIINLQANVPSNAEAGSYPIATLIKTTLPDLRVFVRTGATTFIELNAPSYVFQDWTKVRTYAQARGARALRL